jgi:hypothetical protein
MLEKIVRIITDSDLVRVPCIDGVQEYDQNILTYERGCSKRMEKIA